MGDVRNAAALILTKHLQSPNFDSIQNATHCNCVRFSEASVVHSLCGRAEYSRILPLGPPKSSTYGNVLQVPVRGLWKDGLGAQVQRGGAESRLLVRFLQKCRRPYRGSSTCDGRARGLNEAWWSSGGCLLSSLKGRKRQCWPETSFEGGGTQL